MRVWGSSWATRRTISVAAFVSLSWFLAVPWAGAAVDPGSPDDMVVDLLLYPDDFVGDDVFPAAPRGTLMLSTGSVTISGFVLRSAAGIFNGGPADLFPEGSVTGFWFIEDTDTSISGNMGATILGLHSLGAVIGPEWGIVDPYGTSSSSGSPEVDPYDDLTFTYTIANQPGSFYGNLMLAPIPEPSTALLYACTLATLALLRRRAPQVR